MAEKTRYSDEELEEFRELINEKLEKAQKEYDHLRDMMSNAAGNDVNDTSPTFKNFEEGASTLSKESLSQLSQRQLKFINHLKAALIRIENKTYGICRVTGKLIPKERLRAVPHATTTVEGKLMKG
ncbi:MAG: TraR/DksA C4-type zinc finger protein [Paludibacteraceae bacterium]|nr:TraR/DksA C4-type zinc finger protein [Paludibacteraceae bacterium]